METVRPQTPNQELAGIEEGLPATHQPESESFPDQQGQGTLELESIESKDATPSSHGGQIDGCWQHGSHRGMDGVVRQRERRPEHWFWYSLPRAAKATMILVCISTVMMIAYSIVTISLSSEDEEAHIATVIICCFVYPSSRSSAQKPNYEDQVQIMSLFNLFATVDAIVYENTLQLISSIILSALMLARVLWFIVTRPANSNFLPLKITWGALNVAAQISFIVVALISCREFGWRLYSRLGIDFRRPGAKYIQRIALYANTFNTIMKLDFVFLVVLCALGINISIEGRDQVLVPIMVVSILTFFLNGGLSIMGILVSSSPRWNSRLYILDCLMPLSFAGPIAIVVLYLSDPADVANAAVSTVVSGVVFMLARSGLWFMLHIVSKNAHMKIVKGRVTITKDIVRSKSWNDPTKSSDPDLAPLHEGAWLGKPTPRNPKKKRFFQLSNDGGTLRWGWKKYVRMYYSQDIVYSPSDLSITITFLLESELTLRFANQQTFVAWRKGFEKLMVLLFSPGAEGQLSKSRRQIIGENDIQSHSRNNVQGTSRSLRSGSFVGSLSAASRTPSTDQLQKRQKMAAFLFQGDNRRFKLPMPWFFGGRTPGTNQQKVPSSPPAAEMISVGTQTEEEDFLGFLEDKRHETDEERTENIAAQYASMLNLPTMENGTATQQQVGSSIGCHSTIEPQSPPIRTLSFLSTGISTPSPFSTPADGMLRASSQHALSLESTKKSFDFTSLSSPKPSGSSFAVSVDVVDFESLTLGKLLGAGSEGDVHAAWFLETPVAVKRFNRVDDAAYEVGMYLAIGFHDNIVAMRALSQHEGNMYLIMEYCPRGTLDSMLHYTARSQWDPFKLLPLVRAIARAMYHLHSRHIIHRDLKPANIFVGHGSAMKVGDFGMACCIGGVERGPSEDDILQLVGTVQYAAPELINPDLRSSSDLSTWSKKLDVWSFGITLWEIIERRRPFEGLDETGIQSLWLNSPYQARLPPVRIPDMGTTGGMRLMRALADLVDDCTRLDPDGRPQFGEILQRLKTVAKQ